VYASFASRTFHCLVDIVVVVVIGIGIVAVIIEGVIVV
jgi:hypothetical protein